MSDPLHGGDLPRLHPERVAAVIQRLKAPDDGGWVLLDGVQQETCLAALALVQRSQVAIGITADVADLGVSVRKLVGAAAQVIKRKR